ncbi:MAG: sigma-70 family RNA polymerase sigma factor [Opitutaceae bacterium]
MTSSTLPLTAAPARSREEPVERDTLGHYLQEIGKTPLLALSEEVVLAGRIRRGDRAARNHMIQANLRLVVKIAMDYRDFGVPLMDLISEGNIGLVKAVDRYDPAKGGKLSTYAAWWIRQSIQRALAQARTIRMPLHAIARVSQIRRTTAALAEELGREPTDDELAAELSMPVGKVAHLRAVAVRPASLDAPLADEADSASLGEIVPDEAADSPSEQYGAKALSSDLRHVVGSLDPREAEIIKLRFGLDDGDERTLEEIGRRFDVTRERIRQLEQMALIKIRRRMAEREQVARRSDAGPRRHPRRHRATATGG